MAKRTIVIYSESSTGKTSQIGNLAVYLYNKTGKPLRYITADGGSFDPIKPYIALGIIKPFNLLSTDSVLTSLGDVIEGAFPDKVDEMGNIVEGVRMVKDDLTQFSGYAIEGITTISEAIMTETKGQKMSSNPPFAFMARDSLTKSERRYTAASLSHYNFIQEEVQARVLQSWALPVDTVIWTAHPVDAKDEVTGKPIVGIGLVGKAATTTVSKKVGTLIHIYPVTTKDGKVEFRSYFQPHPDMTYDKTIYVAKSRMHPIALNKMLKLHEGGYYISKLNAETGELEGAIDYYLELEEKFQAEATKEIADRLKIHK